MSDDGKVFVIVKIEYGQTLLGWLVRATVTPDPTSGLEQNVKVLGPYLTKAEAVRRAEECDAFWAKHIGTQFVRGQG